MPLVERRYAEALCAAAEEENRIDAYSKELQAVVDLFDNHPDFKTFLLNPEIRQEAKKEAVRRILEGEAGVRLTNFLMLLIDKGRIRYLPGISKEFVKLAESRKNVLRMTIITAAPLTEAQIERIKERYGRIYNAASVKADIQIEKSQLGGIKVKIGDKVIDATIKGRLEGLRELLVKG